MRHRPSGRGATRQKQRVEGHILQKTDFEADGYDLAEIGAREIFAAGTEIREAEMAGAGEFQTGGDDRGVEIEGRTKLDLYAKLDCAGRKSLAVEDPAATVGKGRGEGRKETAAFFITEALDVERLHCAPLIADWEVLPLGPLSEQGAKA